MLEGRKEKGGKIEENEKGKRKKENNIENLR